MKTLPIKMRARAERGSAECRRLRHKGEVPVNLYGPRQVDGKTQVETHCLAVSAYELHRLVEKGGSSLFEVELDDGRKEIALAKETQRDPFGETILHLDLAIIDVTKPIRVPVELAFKGDSKGQKAGGRLIANIRSLEIEALPLDVPAEIVVRVDDLEMDQSIMVKDLQLPPGIIKVHAVPTQVVVAVLPPELIEEPVAAAPVAGAEGAAAAPAEPEVIGRKKKEDEEEEGAEAAE